MEIPKFRMPNFEMPKFESPEIDLDTPAMREMVRSNRNEHRRKVFGFWWNIVSTLVIIGLTWFSVRLAIKSSNQEFTIETLQNQVDQQSTLIDDLQKQLIEIKTKTDTIQ